MASLYIAADSNSSNGSISFFSCTGKGATYPGTKNRAQYDCTNGQYSCQGRRRRPRSLEGVRFRTDQAVCGSIGSGLVSGAMGPRGRPQREKTIPILEELIDPFPIVFVYYVTSRPSVFQVQLVKNGNPRRIRGGRPHGGLNEKRLVWTMGPPPETPHR